MLQDLFQNPVVLQRAGVASAALSIYAFWPYIRDILLNRTRPDRASWLIWALLSAVSFLSQAYEGADGSLGFAATQAAGTVIICALTFWKSDGLRFRKEDSQVLTATAVGIWLWAEMETAAYSLMVTIGMSCLGGALTAKKAFDDPDSETMSTWVAFFVASLLAVVAIGRIDWVLLAYPVYVMVLSGGIIVAMVLGRMRAQQPDLPSIPPVPAPAPDPGYSRQQLTMSIMSLERAGSSNGSAQKGS
ncbi:hypothetical protein [uncultured Tateyamaria sp.]|uniref:hypothetical protein n=1 Tax=uncultured Tateyamaria sp. TaxID=455651 RepID=UPI00261A5C0A|nr:hypothetical protein [uncultured Tateyamaria sp.]